MSPPPLAVHRLLLRLEGVAYVGGFERAVLLVFHLLGAQKNEKKKKRGVFLCEWCGLVCVCAFFLLLFFSVFWVSDLVHQGMEGY